MAESTQPVHPVQPIHPPPCKKRKVYRRRPQSEDEEEESVHIASPPTTTHSELMSLNEMIRLSSHNADAKADDKVETPFSVAEVLRQRKATQRRRGGIEFRHGGTAVTHDSPGTQATSSPQDEEQKLDKIITVVDRFAPQTGQVADVDQHMMAYIDSELAKRRYMHATSSDPAGGAFDRSTGNTIDAVVQRQPAALGKLQEVDLGPDAASLNIARTEAAKRRLEGLEMEHEEIVGKVRLGKDGKPRRARWRRNSDDIKRDKLVEEVLKETKLDIYDEPEVELPNDDQAADDRIAEQFRREFMDAISQRRQKTAQSKKTGPGAVDDKAKGPKLGGSRSARAAMRELQEKATKK